MLFRSTGTFAISNYNSANTYTVVPNVSVVISPTGIVTAPAGQYVVTATNTSLCVSAPATITVLPQPATPAIPIASTVIQPTCTDAYGHFNITNYNNGLNYIFTPSANVTVDALGNVTLPSGSYQLYATNGICNSTSITITVNSVPNAPAIPIVNNVIHPTCNQANGNFTIANYNSALTYTFIPNANVSISETGVVTALAGSYIVTVSNSFGCMAQSSIIVLNAQPTTPTTPILSSVTQPTCDNPYGMVQIVNYNNGWNYSFTPSVGV